MTQWDPPHSPPQWKICPKMAYFFTPVEKTLTPPELFCQNSPHWKQGRINSCPTQNFLILTYLSRIFTSKASPHSLVSQGNTWKRQIFLLASLAIYTRIQYNSYAWYGRIFNERMNTPLPLWPSGIHPTRHPRGKFSQKWPIFSPQWRKPSPH